MMNRLYTQEEVQQILNLAIARQADAGEFTREQLLEIALDLGISPTCLQVAEEEWQQQQSLRHQQQAFDAYRWSKLKKKTGRFLIVSGFVVPVSLLIFHGFFFPLALLLFLIWGLSLSLDTWNTYQMQGEEYERAFQKWYRNHQIRRTLNFWLGKLLKA